MKPASFAFALALLAATAAAQERRPLEHDLRVELQPAENRLAATDRVRLSAGDGPVVLHLARELAIESVSSEGTALSIERSDSVEGRTVAHRIALGAAGGERVIEVRYAGRLHQDSSGTKFNREAIAGSIDATIGPEGVFLAPSAAWYPSAGDGLARFRVEISTPAGFESVCEGERIERTAEGGTTRAVFQSEMPLDGVHCIAGPYAIVERTRGKVVLQAYVHEADRELADPYLADVARYLDLYEGMLGPYPFAKFAVVESFFPSGYGMPSFTYLGAEVMRLPFIRQTSLGHEVLHSWWGNSVLVDSSEGNWCEGLTTYLADHFYESEADGGRDYRRRSLADYASYVSETKEIPLSGFRSRHDSATRAIGYGKGMMVFRMLDARFGTERFLGALRRVTKDSTGRFAGWRHFRRAFEEETGEDLDWFFEQWIERPGAPRLSLGEASLVEDPASGESRLRISLAAEPSYRVRVPVEIRLSGETSIRRTIDSVLGPEPRTFEWLLAGDSRPVEVVVDPDFDSMRLMDPAEIPATLRLAFGAEGLVIVLPSGASQEMAEAYDDLVEGLSESMQFTVVRESELAGRLPASPAIVLGRPDENGVAKTLLARLAPRVACEDGAFRAGDGSVSGQGAMLVVATKTAPDRVALVVASASPSAVAAAGHKLVHYGRYGYLLFDAGKNVGKGVLDAPESPLVRRIGG